MIVIDVSAAYAIVDRTERGLGLAGLMLQGEKALAPALFFSEAANAAWKSVKYGSMALEQARGRFEAAVRLVDEFQPDSSLAVEAMESSIAYGHPVYDMLYLVLARRSGATLFTLDRKLVDICREAKVNCVEEAAI